MRKLINIFFLLFPFYFYGFSQEILVPPAVNQDAREYYLTRNSPKKAGVADTLELPFIDDFSDSYVEPKPELWSDNQAYINNRYSKNPVTAGIATLDAYDFNGAPYAHASTSPYIADILTSLPVNLAYPPSDSIYLSFYYQAKGLGEQPDVQDSLCLEFYNIDSLRWERIWSMPGKEMPEFENVMIPVTQTEYLKKGFRFRFLNYATVPLDDDYADEFSNFDHWHLDYIILDRNRNFSDTILHDVSFVNPVSSILKDYESVPWSHMEEAFFTQRQPVSTVIVNNDNITRNVTKFLRIVDLETGGSFKSLPTANDFSASQAIPFTFDYDYSFNFNSPSPALFEITTVLETDAFDYKINDTLSREQSFDNFYAYDDGSSEYGYGLSAQGTANAMVAVRFYSYQPDSLRAVDMYFNQVIDSINLGFYFYLNVWDDNNGKPGNLIYSQVGEHPEYKDVLNKFARYDLDSAVYVNGTFYVGWRKTVDKLSNIGFDLNKDNRSNNFYNLGPGWQQSVAVGSIMIRPVVSMAPLVLGNRNIEIQPEIIVYPNPADQFVKIELKEYSSEIINITIYDITGRMFRKVESYVNENIYTGDLPRGIFLITIELPERNLLTTRKIIIQH